MILNFPDQNQKIEKTFKGAARLSEGEWNILPSRQTFLVPITLPARLMRRLGESQIRGLVFDRIPLPAESSKVWLLIPRLGFFSTGLVTAWAVVAPLSALPAGFDRCIPEDLLLAALARDKRFKKGGLIALDTPQGITVIGIRPKAKSVQVWKHLITSGAPSGSTDIPDAVTALLGRGSILLRLNAGGSFEPILNKYGTVVTEDAAAGLSNSLPMLMSHAHASISPNLFAEAKPPAGSSAAVRRLGVGISRTTWLWFRSAILLAALILPCASLWFAKDRADRVSARMLNEMRTGYEKRFGIKIPESLASNPLLALRDKSRSVSGAARPTAVPFHLWLALVDRLSAQAASSVLRLDAVSLDGVRVEIRGTAADLESVARWVSGLSSDPALTEAALVSSETRFSDKRIAFKVRARMRLAESPS